MIKPNRVVRQGTKSRCLQQPPVIAKEEAMWLSKVIQTGDLSVSPAVESESHPVTREGVKSQCHLCDELTHNRKQ
jgi:hypothetical protein